MKVNPIFVLILLLMLIPSWCFAQMNRRAIKKNNKRITSYAGNRTPFSKRYSFIGLSMNSVNYFGDLSPRSNRVSTDISLTKPGFAISIARRLGPRYTLQAQFLYGTIKGTDVGSANPLDSEGHARYLRNLSFQNHIKELSVVAYYDFFANRRHYSYRLTVAPYVYMGLAVLLHNPQARTPQNDLEGNAIKEAGDWVSLHPLGTEGQYSTLNSTDANFGIKPYSLLVVAIPFGMGSRFKLTKLLDLWVEIGIRYTFTDYLDDVSKNYVDLGVLNSTLARTMSYRTTELGLPSSPVTYIGRDQFVYTVQNGYGQELQSNMRGNQNANDLYMITSLRLTHIIPDFYKRAKHR